MLRALLALCLLLCSGLMAEVLELSPSANALAGISLLSDSVADTYLSPAQRVNGCSCYYIRPFGMGDIPFYGIATGFERDWLYLAAGSMYLNHPDYQWHNPYLNLCIEYACLAVGAGVHLDYSQVESAEALFDYSLAYAARYRYRASSLELRAYKPSLPEGEYSLSLAQDVLESGSLGLALVKEKSGEICYKTAVNAQLNNYLRLYGSWQNNPARFGAGINCNYAKWSLIYSLRSHPRLSMSQAFALEYTW